MLGQRTLSDDDDDDADNSVLKYVMHNILYKMIAYHIFLIVHVM